MSAVGALAYVRPVLQLHRIWHHGDRTGIRLSNCGLGPAIITNSRAWVGGGETGPWTSTTVIKSGDERLSPLKHRDLNLLGHYSFTAPAAVALRPLRDPDAVELDEDDDGSGDGQ